MVLIGSKGLDGHGIGITLVQSLLCTGSYFVQGRRLPVSIILAPQETTALKLKKKAIWILISKKLVVGEVSGRHDKGLSLALVNHKMTQEIEAGLCPGCSQQEALASTGYIVGRWKKNFEELLN